MNTTTPLPRTGPLTIFERLMLPLRSRIGRLLRWEFWPAAIVYAPMIPYLAWLTLRHGSLRVCTLVNPTIPLGGLIGESKTQLLELLPESVSVPTFVVEPGPVAERLRGCEEVIASRNWVWPLVFKPDVGERGAGVRLINNRDEARAYLTLQPERIMVQVYHPGPFEVGIFYMRVPGHKEGQVFSITDKRFPSVVGDGFSPIRALIWRHARYRLQAHVFLKRLGQEANRVPSRGEVVSLGMAGNHCLGTLFLDGAHLKTPELTASLDEITKSNDCFFFGRLDVRYSRLSDLQNGYFGRDGMQVLEVNGLTSESTNMYDPRTSFWMGQRILREQWCWAFRIGAQANRQGRGQLKWRHVLDLVQWWLLEKRTERVSEQSLSQPVVTVNSHSWSRHPMHIHDISLRRGPQNVE